MRISRGKPNDLSDPPDLTGPTQAESSCDSFSTVEATLLGCFGMDQFAERSQKALRAALLDSGMPGSAAGHLIRSSPLLERASKGQYRLRQLGD